jgi:hypothetical protein
MRESLDAASDPNAALVTFVGSLSGSQARALRTLLRDAGRRRRS